MEILIEEKVKNFLTVDVYDHSFHNGYGVGNIVGKDDYSGHCSDNFIQNYNYSNNGSGFGSSSGFDYGNCHGSGCGGCKGIKELNGNRVYLIDNIQTIFISIHGNVAKGYILLSDLILKPCFIAKGNGKFAHGETIREAFDALQKKLYDNSTEKERIEAFVKKFPEYDKEYDNKDLFFYHHILTGSCEMGRETFISNKGLSLDDKTTIREFVELTQYEYGGNIIRKLPSVYLK